MAAAFLLLAPGAMQVSRSPYGWRPLEAWLAVAALLVAYLLLFALTDRLLRLLPVRSAIARVVVGVVVGVTLFFALLLVGVPFSWLLSLLPEPISGTASWSAPLVQKYLQHFALAPTHNTAPLVALSAVVLGFITSQPAKTLSPPTNAA